MFRAAQYAALGDPNRLAIVDALLCSDRTPTELATRTGLASNLLAFHLNVLEDAHVIARVTSEADRRRRYVTLHPNAPTLHTQVPLPRTVLFVCTKNQARSQFAAALWQQHTGTRAYSAGLTPAAQPDPTACAIAKHHGIDTDRWQTRRYDEVPATPTHVISVCDRAHEAGISFPATTAHWSIKDPAGQTKDSYEQAFRAIDQRITRLVQHAPLGA